MKKPYLYMAAFVVALAIYVFYPNNSSRVNDNRDVTFVEERSMEGSEKQSQESRPRGEELNDRSSSRKDLASLATSDLRSFHNSFPDKNKVNEEFRTNPHTPSSSLMTFSKKLGPLMEKAFESEQNANSLVRELSYCAVDESVAKAARATCVTSTERLGESYPRLKDKARKLRASVAPEVQKILNTNDAFIKKQ